EIPMRPASRDALEWTDVTAALVIVRVLEQVFETECLFMSLRGNSAIQVQQLIIGKTDDVIMHVARRINEHRMIWIGRVSRTADYQVAVAAVDEHSVEPEQTPVSCSSNRALRYLTARRIEQAINDFHLVNEPLRIDG